jgi:hypothetical protein
LLCLCACVCVCVCVCVDTFEIQEEADTKMVKSSSQTLNRLRFVALLVVFLWCQSLVLCQQQQQQQAKSKQSSTQSSSSSQTSTQSSTSTPADPYDCKGNTPFLLQDPRDNTCLGPNGFTACDERALWVLNRRVDRVGTYSLALFLPPTTANNHNAAGHCLERKTSLFGLIGLNRIGLGKCSKRSSKNWKFEFVDGGGSNNVLLSTKGMCLVRGALGFANSVSLKPCSELKPDQQLKLTYSPTAIHENGFYLKASDGSCFDGSSFRSCYGVGASKLLWGIGMRYVGGEAVRYLFLFSPKERHNCLVHKGTDDAAPGLNLYNC